MLTSISSTNSIINSSHGQATSVPASNSGISNTLAGDMRAGADQTTPIPAPKTLSDYLIKGAKVALTIIISPFVFIMCAVSYVVAYLKLNIETLINRYKHYKKYHPGNKLCQPFGMINEKRQICNDLANCCRTIISSINRLRNDPIYRAVFNKLISNETSAETREVIQRLENEVNQRYEALKAFIMDMYKNPEIRSQYRQGHSELNALCEAFSQSTTSLMNSIESAAGDHINIPRAETVKAGETVTLSEKVASYQNWFSKRLVAYRNNEICPHCCPLSVSHFAEILPYSLRAILFTLHKLVYYPFLAAVGAYRTGEMVLSWIWGTNTPINYFPWHPGESHRFPFSTSEHKGMEGIWPDTSHALAATAAGANSHIPSLIPTST